MFWNNRQHLHSLAYAITGAGWLLASCVLVIGTLVASRYDASIELMSRIFVSAAVLAAASMLAWGIRHYADRRI